MRGNCTKNLSVNNINSQIIFLSAMMDAAKWFNAKKLRSSFSYRTESFRKGLNQLCATSTTQRLAFFSGSRLSLLSTPFDVRNIAMFLNHSKRRRTCVTRIST